MLQVERVEKIEQQIKFPELQVGEVFTWGAGYDPYIKVDSNQGFRLTTPHGLSTIDRTMILRRCEAKLFVTGIAEKYKSPNTGI